MKIIGIPGYLCGYTESVILGVVLRVSEGLSLDGNHRDTGIPVWILRIGNFEGGSQGI